MDNSDATGHMVLAPFLTKSLCISDAQFSLIARLLQVERESKLLCEELAELRAEHALDVAKVDSYVDHTHLILFRQIHVPRDPLRDDGQR